MTIKHPKGRKESYPFILKFTSSLEETYMFTEESKYDLQDPVEQRDWLKLTGIATNPLNAKISSVMAAWRYRIDLDQFELVPYWHDADGKRHYDESDTLLVDPNEKFTIWIAPNVGGRMYVVYISSNRHSVALTPPVKPTWYSRRISAWFGGTLPAPSDVTFKLIK